MKVFPMVALIGLIWAGEVSAGCTLTMNAETLFDQSAGVAEVFPVSREVVKLGDGRIVTRYALRISRSFKGTLPTELTIESPGGTLGGEVAFASNSLDLKVDESYVMHFSNDPVGVWVPEAFGTMSVPSEPAEASALRHYFQAGARGDRPEAKAARVSKATAIPPSRVTATGFVESRGLPTRFTECDAGIKLPYLVDLDPTKLPPGVTPESALQMVAGAFGAWEGPSSLKFYFAGLSTAEERADAAVPAGFILVQLHDNFQTIGSTSTLGTGGGRFTQGNLTGPWAHGTVAGQRFESRLSAYVIMNHRSAFSQPSLFGQVLTHEIGHALGLGHSSEDPAEPEPLLAEATMYFSTNGDGRNTAIKAYDEDRIKFGYPLNTPPYSIDRVIRVVSGSPQPTGQGVDRVTLAASDLQTPDLLTREIIPDDQPPNTGTFSVSGDTATFALNGVYSDSVISPEQIEAGSNFGKIGLQYSDGVNLSRIHWVRVSGIAFDSTPADGLADTWMTQHFGTTQPGAAGSSRHPSSDPDGDGLTNRIEHYLGTNPNDPNSGLPSLTLDPQTKSVALSPTPYSPQILETSADLNDWSMAGLVHSVDSTVPHPVYFSANTDNSRRFYRIKIDP